MSLFDVYPMPNNRHGYVVDVQADLLGYLATRAVVPLLPLDDFQSPIRDLNPIFEIDGVRHVFAPQSIATVPVKAVAAKAAAVFGRAFREPTKDGLVKAGA